MPDPAPSGGQGPPEGAPGRRRVRRRAVVAELRLGDQSAPTATAGLDESRYEIVRLRVDRNLISRLLLLTPNIVVIDTSVDAFDHVQVAAAVRRAMDTRVVVVSRVPVDDRQIIDAFDAGATTSSSTPHRTCWTLVCELRCAAIRHPPANRPSSAPAT